MRYPIVLHTVILVIQIGIQTDITNMMNQNQSRIQQHKQDIQKRITQLQNKLRQPLNNQQQDAGRSMDQMPSHSHNYQNRRHNYQPPRQLNDPPSNTKGHTATPNVPQLAHNSNLPNSEIKRSMIRREQYVQPKQVSLLRERQYSATNRNPSNNNSSTKQNEWGEQVRTNSQHKYQLRNGQYQGRGPNNQQTAEAARTKYEANQSKDKIRCFSYNLTNIQNSRNNQQSSEPTKAVHTNNYLNTYNLNNSIGKLAQLENNYTHSYSRANSAKKNDSSDNKQLFELMSEILKNQKNLQKEIYCLRNQWNQGHVKNQHKFDHISPLVDQSNAMRQLLNRQNINTIQQRDTQKSLAKYKNTSQNRQNNGTKTRNKQNINQIVSFNQQHEAGKVDRQDKPRQKYGCSIRKRAQNKMKRNQLIQMQTFAPYSGQKQTIQANKPTLQAQSLIQKVTNNHKNDRRAKAEQSVGKGKPYLNRKQNFSSPRNQVGQPQVPISKTQQVIQSSIKKLINNQKKRNQRFIVTSGHVSQFWKKVEWRLKSIQRENQIKQKQYTHKKFRHENDHLVNTMELQRKSKQEVISKILGQANNYVYK